VKGKNQKITQKERKREPKKNQKKNEKGIARKERKEKSGKWK